MLKWTNSPISMSCQAAWIGVGLGRSAPDDSCWVMTAALLRYFGTPKNSTCPNANPGGRVAIVDYYKRKGAMGGKDSTRALTHIRLDEADVVKEIEGFGYKLVSSKPFLPDVQYLAIFEKK